MFVVPALHVLQSILCIEGLYVSYVSITNLRQYEEQTKQAAKYSNTAEHQLYKTRTTQASGALAILGSFIVSATLSMANSHFSGWWLSIMSPAMLLVTLAARTYVSNFWQASAKVPLMDGYNEAISKTKDMIRILEWLEYSWAGAALAIFTIGY